MSSPELKKSKPDLPSCIPVPPARNVPDLVEDVREGLVSPPRSLPPKYFYDEKGSQLFTRICETREYYPTRTEDNLLELQATTIIETARPDQIIELGSGNSQKTRHLFNACEINNHGCFYAPFDVCAPMLEQTAEELEREYDWLEVTPLLGDYHAGLRYLPEFSGRRLFVFLGSTIGNFEMEEAKRFLEELAGIMNKGDYLLIGADRVKDTDILMKAYNDGEGITAAFNLNLLEVLNRELDGDLNPEYFSHRAVFNNEKSRIEMRLVCRFAHKARLRKIDKVISFEAGEEILTEVSHKYTYESAESLLEDGGLTIVSHFEPDNRYFSLILARCD